MTCYTKADGQQHLAIPRVAVHQKLSTGWAGRAQGGGMLSHSHSLCHTALFNINIIIKIDHYTKVTKHECKLQHTSSIRSMGKSISVP